MQRLSFVGRISWLALLCPAVALPFLGCEWKNPEIPQPTLDRMQTIYAAYNKAAEALGRGPKDLAEFKKYLPPSQNVDDLLTSPHDGKPYKLVWNVNPRTPPQSEVPPVMAYEQEGKDGMFDVLTTMGIVRCNGEELKNFLTNTPAERQ